MYHSSDDGINPGRGHLLREMGSPVVLELVPQCEAMCPTTLLGLEFHFLRFFFFNFSGAYINILLWRQGGGVRERRGRGKESSCLQGVRLGSRRLIEQTSFQLQQSPECSCNQG